MGTWISHLRIAENLLGHFPELDEVTFTFGNLSPDSGIPNADWTEFDPPKEVTHFLRKGEGEDAIHDLVYYEQYLLNIKPEKDWFSSLPYRYLNESTVSRIVDESMQAVLLVHKKLQGIKDLDGMKNSVSLLPQALIMPYESPLGN